MGDRGSGRTNRRSNRAPAVHQARLEIRTLVPSHGGLGSARKKNLFCARLLPLRAATLPRLAAGRPRRYLKNSLMLGAKIVPQPALKASKIALARRDSLCRPFRIRTPKAPFLTGGQAKLPAGLTLSPLRF